MKFVLSLFAIALFFCVSCEYEQEEIPTLPALPVYGNAIPVSQIKEPGCELQMELDPLWHHNQYRDSNYIRDLVVNPKNPNQWIYIQSILKPGKSWNILWFVDVQKREKKQLDSVSFMGYGDLTWGGQFVGFKLGNGVGIINMKNGAHLAIPHSSYVKISPNGEYIFYSENGQSLVAQLEENSVFNSKISDISLAYSVWPNDYTMYTFKKNKVSNELEFGTYDVTSNIFTTKFIYNSRNAFIECLSLAGDQLFFSGHNALDLTTQDYERFFPYCERQRFERIIPLTKTREYLVLKRYKKTVEPKTTLVYQHFHVFDENWENERRVTLNFDF